MIKRNNGMMTKEEVVSYLEGANGKEIHLGLEVMQALMEVYDWPCRNQKIIHVTGTNGKGSVCEILSQILQCEGYKVGVFNSPYFEVPNECIRVNDEMISDEEMIQYMSELREKADQLEEKKLYPSAFECLTTLALQYFKDQKVDYVILEVGLGGRLDATNIIEQSSLSIISKIAIDHKNFLGSTLESIAKEKAEIIKKNGLVLIPRQEEILNVVEEVCHKENAELCIMEPEKVKLIEMTDQMLWFRYKEEAYCLNLIGSYQAYNASLAIEAVNILNAHGLSQVHKAAIKNGLAKVRWAGRFEKIKENPLCFIDGAHNVDGIRGLSETLYRLPRRKNIAIVGILKDKEVEEMVELIGPQIDTFIVTKPLNPRAMEPNVLAEKFLPYGKVYIKDEIEEALSLALKLASEEENTQIIGFGSLYMIGKLRSCFLALEDKE